MNAVVLTIWLCLATKPQCATTEDPTGPPVVRVGPADIKGCEAHFKALVEAYPPPKGAVARHTCTWQGEDI